jgi:16S rRNA G966 N2-methylase RsmD
MSIQEKIFPFIENYADLKYDIEGLWSISNPNDADLVSKEILSFRNKEIHILDTTAGLGGNTISFCKMFTKVTCIENNSERFELLKNNLLCYKFNNVTLINDNCINYLKQDYDVYFIDPPWGGPDYKLKLNIDVILDNINIKEIVKIIPKNKLIVLKLPFNCNINFNYIKKIKLNNIILYFIETSLL